MENETATDGQEWVSVAAIMGMFQLSRKYVLRLAKTQEWTRRQAHCRATPDFLRREVDSWADFRRLRQGWKLKYRGAGVDKRWREKLDTETARRLFIPSEEAAALLGVSVETVRSLARRGRLFGYQSAPNHSGSRLWFSRRAVLQLKEDPDRVKRQGEYWKGRTVMPREADRGMQLARTVRDGIPEDWLTTREAAERLGVSVSRVRELRLTGRIRGEQIWRRMKPMRFWYFPVYEVERVLAWRGEEKALRPPPPTPCPIADALPIPASGGGEEDAGTERRREREGDPFGGEGPEPVWACDEAAERRAFFRLDL